MMKAFFVLFMACHAAVSADYLTGQAARLVIGQQNFTALLAQQPVTQGILGGASGVAYGNNTLFVADGNHTGEFPVNNRVLVYTPVSGFPTPANVPTPQQNSNFSLTCPICIGNPALVVGQADFVSNAQALTQNGLRTPTAVATDGTVLAVADTDNNRVLIWKSLPAASGQNADIVVGQVDFTHGTATVPPTAATLRGPQGVWIANGKLIVADTIDNRVLIYNSIPTSNGAAADVVIGAPDFTTLIAPPVTQDVVTPTQTNLASPTSATTDGAHLYVSDLGHNRVLIWNTIPTSNNAPADVVLGQPDFVSGLSNNSSKVCPSNGADTTVTPNVPTYPYTCGTALSFPRFTLSDGQRLYVADGGNDRVLVYNSIPAADTTNADVILGQPDENTVQSTTNSDAMATPSALAWDGANLYVADTYNLRVLVFTPLGSALPVTGVRNAASLEIFASGFVTFGGTITAKDTVTITIGATAYTYTVQTGDTPVNVVNGLTAQINGSVSGSTADANVIATPDTVNPAIFFTARVPGTAGVGTALSTSTSTSATITATASGSTIAINLASAVQIAPGALISVFGVNLSDQTAAFDFTQPSLPRTLGGATLYIDGLQAPLLYVSATQINAQMPYEVLDRSSVSIYVVTAHAGGSPTATNAIGTSIVSENPGLFAGVSAEPRPGIVNHLTANAAGLVSVDGTVTAGNTASITIAGTVAGVAVSNTYTYTVLSTDTLDTVRDGLIALMANDPLVTATPTNVYDRIVLEARVPGVGGNSIAYTVAISTSSTLTLTALAANLCCGNSGGGPVTVDNPAAPGELLYTYATGLGETSPATDSNTGQLVSGTLNPPATPVDSILVAGKSASIVYTTLVPGYVGLFQVTFQIPTGLPDDNLTQLTIAQQLFVSNIVTFPVATPATP